MDFFLSGGLGGDHNLVGAGGDLHIFTKFVLSSSPYTQSTLDAISNVLAEDPRAGAELLQSENSKALFISDFSERLVRIQAWLTSLAQLNPRHSVYNFVPKIIHGFAHSIVIPLLHSEYSDCHSLQGFTEFLILTTRLSWTHRKHKNADPGFKALSKLLLTKIANIQHLVQSILPSNEGANLMQNILAEAQAGAKIQALGSVKTLEGWLTAAADLCSSCPGNHGLKAELDRWNCLMQLRDSLTRVLHAECARRDKSTLLAASRINLTHMRKLSLDDKKSGASTHAGVAKTNHPPLLAENLTEKDAENLQVFNMKAPTGIGSLENLLAILRERESIFLFECIVKSFPCPLCARRLTLPTDQRRPEPQTTSSSRAALVGNLPRSFTDTLFGQRLGPWRICLSESALKDLLSVNKESQDAIRGICGKLKELASGNWDLESLRMPISQKMLNECHGLKERVSLWRAAYGRRGRILWQVNVNYDEEEDNETQMITVWRIGTSDEIRKSIRDVLHVQSTYTKSHIQRCSFLLHDFPLFPKQYFDASDDPSYPQAEPAPMIMDDFQENLLSNRFYSMTEKVLDCIFASPDTIEFPFEISKNEMNIVKHSNSAAFILGRSGTGKTTCLLFKLLCRNIASRSYEGAVRQILLTRSSYLAANLTSYLERLMQSQLGRDFAMSRGRADQNQSMAQGFIQEATDPLEDHTLDTLHDGNFPLVCTFDQLFSFLEKAIQLADSKSSEPLSIYDQYLSKTRPGARTSRLVDYNVFSNQYWKRNYQRKTLEPDLVFAEILGIIKGSTSIERGYKPLSREEYLEMSMRRAPIFTDEYSRSIVYDMYENYESQKGRLRDQDGVDRAINLLKALERNKELKKQVQTLFDEVYVDEVQDNRLLEIDLLLTLVRNPQGIHFAGDTAQCISRDNTFRFEDIKARFYEFFFAMAQKAHKPEWAKAKLIKLPKNYRSHQGILSLAANIIELLVNGFPGQIDECPPELGSFQGAKPTFFLGFGYQILAHEIPEAKTGRAMGYFGAEQVIIVRNDAAKEELKGVLGSTLILTIYNSKGLEFEDVVLYNFFSESTWDTVRLRTLELLLRKDAVDVLDKGKYAGLCSELKQLYVAVTRAKKNLWIVENNRAAGENIVALWTKTVSNSLVTLIDGDDAQAEKQARSIMKPRESRNSDAWKKQGEMLFQRSLYEDALFCFRMAKHKQGEDLVNAFLLFEKASQAEGEVESISTERSQKAKKLYSEAAKLFENVLFIQKAAESWAAAGEYRSAGRVLKTHKQYGKAALWYARAEDFREAAECHTFADQHDEAVHAYRKGEHFAELLEYLGRYQEKISKSVSKRYSTLINILLQRGDLSEALLPAAIDTLGDDNEVEKFYEKFNRTEDLLAFYIKRQRYHDFFKLAISEGMFENAVIEVLEGKKVGANTVDDDIPPQDFMALITGLSAMDTWNACGFQLSTLNKIRLPVTQAPPKPAGALWARAESLDNELGGYRCGWEEIAKCIWKAGNELKLPRQQPDSVYSGFFTKFGNDFLDLVEFLRLDTSLCMAVPQVTNMNQLPVATMQKFASLAGNLLSKRIPPQSLLTSVGALILSHLDVEVIILSSSPLFPIVSRSEENITSTPSSTNRSRNFAIVKREQAYEALTEWLVPIVRRVILPTTLEHLRNLLAVDKTHRLCFMALQGSCRKPEEQCNAGRHTKLTPEELKEHTSCLLDAAELSCASERLYYTPGPNKTDIGAQYIKNRRAFLESILKELTFISPMLNDSELQQEIWSTIISNNPGRQWPHVRDGLESLFFHRLRPSERVKRGTVSALLEERSFANRLGVMPRFVRSLWQTWRYSNTGREGDKEIAYRNFQFIRGCNDIFNHNIGILVGNIRLIVVNDISTPPINHLQSFHAVLSLYEYLSLELLNRTSREELLVPRSRQQLIRDLSNYPEISDDEKHSLQKCLMNLLNNLCQQLMRFFTEYERVSKARDEAKQRGEKPSSDPKALFEACGRRLWDGNRYMVRRALDHLALCAVNMGVGRKNTLLDGYNNLCVKVKEVRQAWAFLNPPTMIVWWDSITPEDLAKQLCNVYQNYNKDELVIVGPASSGRARFDFLTASRRITRVIMGPLQDTPISSKTDSNQESTQQADEEAAAASKLAAWWRRCSMRLLARKEYDKKRANLLAMGPEGQAQAIITKLTRSMISSRSRQQRDIIENEGVTLLAGVLGLLQFIEITHHQAMDVLTDTGEKYELSSMAVEAIQVILGYLEKQKTKLQLIRDKFEQKGRVQALLESPVKKLKEAIEGAFKALEKYQNEADKWESELQELLD